MMKKLIAFIMLILISANANADCWLNGTRYTTGAVVGGLTCQPDGSWG